MKRNFSFRNRYLIALVVFALTPVLAQEQIPKTAGREKKLTRDETALQSEILEKHFKVALLVGIGDYDQTLTGLSGLKYPVPDIHTIAKQLKLQDYTPILLRDSNATAARIRQQLKDIASMVEKGQGTVLFYFSGHGFRVGDENYLATFGTTMGDLSQQGLKLSEVQQLLMETGAKQRIAFIDACRNDPTAKSASARSFDAVKESEGLRILYSTAPGKVSYEDDVLQHGVFSYFVANALHGEAAGSDGMITFNDVQTYVTTRMRAYGTENQKAQIPYQMGESTGDFLLAKKLPAELAEVTETKGAQTQPAPPPARQTVETAAFPSNSSTSNPGPANSSTEVAQTNEDPPSRVARLSLTDGQVSLRPAGLEEWTEAEINRPITTGDSLWIDEIGHAELQIGNGVLRLGEKTGFSFLNLDDQTAQIKLSQGTLTVRMRRIDKGESVEVDTPNAVFSIVRPGDYKFEVAEGGAHSALTVQKGLAEAGEGNKILVVQPKQSVNVDGIESPVYTSSNATAPAAADRYFAASDSRQEKSISSNYVAEDVIGAEDLDQNGTWSPLQGLGMGWMPNVDAGWEPYRNGHWAWVQPWGWTWVDDAPWGFAPFHYGRWVRVGGRWAWLPGGGGTRAVYSPALVAWAGVPGGGVGVGVRVGWFPLGPREVYVPAYYASRRYANRINVTNVNIANVNVTNVNVGRTNYVNRTHATAMSREAFAGSRPISSRSMSALSSNDMAQAQIGNSAAIAPRRDSLLGRRGSGGNVARPADTMMNRPVVARSTPPPARVPFSRQEGLLQNNPGKPLRPSEMAAMQQASAPRQDVRQAGSRPLLTQVQPSRTVSTPAQTSARANDPKAMKQQRENQKREEKARQAQEKQSQRAARDQEKQKQNEAKVAERNNREKQKIDRKTQTLNAKEQKPKNSQPRTSGSETAKKQKAAKAQTADATPVNKQKVPRAQNAEARQTPKPARPANKPTPRPQTASAPAPRRTQAPAQGAQPAAQRTQTPAKRPAPAAKTQTPPAVVKKKPNDAN